MLTAQAGGDQFVDRFGRVDRHVAKFLTRHARPVAAMALALPGAGTALPPLSPSPSPSVDVRACRSVAAWAPPPPDALDLVVAYLKKRDGTDKVLKVLRYASRVLLATTLTDPTSAAAARARSFETAIGDARKCYRLGKFLQGVNELRRVDGRAPTAPLAVLAHAGDAAYYFLEQFTWLIRAG